jgi:hypothetical protein
MDARAVHSVPTAKASGFDEVNVGGNLLHIKAGQFINHDRNQQYRNVDSISGTASFDSSVDFRLTESEFMLEDMALELSLSALTQTGGTTIRYVDAPLMLNRVEIYANSGAQLVQTIDAWHLRMVDVLHLSNESATFKNKITDAAAAGTAQTFYIRLHSFINTIGGYPLFATTGDLTVRVYFRSLADSVVQDGTAPVGSIASAKLKVKLSEVSAREKQEFMASQMRHPKLYRFMNTRITPIPVASGSTSIRQVLNSVRAPISHMTFVITDSNPTGADLEGGYTALQDFVVLNASGENQTGKQVITDAFNRNFLAGEWFSSTTTTTENIYAYSWASNPELALSKGINSGVYEKSGSDVLEINFGSALSSASTIYLMEYTYSFVELYKGGIKVLT